MEAMALHRPRMEIHPAAHLREFVSFFLGRWKGLELTHRHTPTHTDTHRHTHRRVVVRWHFPFI